MDYKHVCVCPAQHEHGVVISREELALLSSAFTLLVNNNDQARRFFQKWNTKRCLELPESTDGSTSSQIEEDSECSQSNDSITPQTHW